jgi:putative transposase
VSPARRRDAVRFLQKRRRVSERQACRVVGQHRSTQRYRRLEPAYERALVARMNELAAAHPRYGYRRICALLCGEGFAVNRKKRIEGLWRAEDHRVPPRRSQARGRKAQGRAANAPWNLAASAPTRSGRTTS